MRFSIGDRLFNFVFNKYEYPYNEQYNSKKYDFSNKKDLWLVFLPWKTSISLGEKLYLIPKMGTVIAYEQVNAMINHNPKEAMRIFKKMIGIVINDISKYKGYKINVISYSAGNGFGFYITNNFKINKFISVVTGANLGECIFKCIATQHVKQKCLNLGINNFDEYDKIIKGYIPQDSYKNISAKSTFYISKFDEYFLDQGLRIANLVKVNNKNTEIKIIPLGHMVAILYFGFLNRFKLINDIYE